MALTGLSVFLGAFLLFLVQPIVAKLILPRFGGSVAVWATCLVFFQAALLLGYDFAHQLVRRDASRAWRYAHVALLLASLGLLPIVPVRLWPDAQQAEPALQILGLLLLTLGLPFTLLAMTSPLLQAWLALSRTPRDPYRLFALSNGASLAALLAYPWLIEPWLRTATQALVWSAAYALYVLALCAISLRRPWPQASADPAPADVAPPGPARTLTWFALAALGSGALVALTNHLTQNIPSFPMMWVLPLVIYLLSFTLAFEADRWTPPRVWRGASLLALAAMCLMLLLRRRVGSIGWEIAVFLFGLFVVCMFCHGELARSRPAPSQLTRFYLTVSAGGVVGGALVALAAPALLPGYFEVEIVLLLLAAAVLWRSLVDLRTAPPAGTSGLGPRGGPAGSLPHLRAASFGNHPWGGPAGSRPHLRAAPFGIRPWGGPAGSWPHGRAWVAAAAAVLLGSALTLVLRVDEALSEVSVIGRNFYGVVRVREYGRDQTEAHERVLVHGTVMHGQQFLAPQLLRRPTSYYTPNSGVGRLLRALHERPIEVGAVGLGAGTIAAYGKTGDRYRFYEIDDAIVRAAYRHFSFIADSAARVDVAVGDGRLLLQQEAEARFDVLVVDAFSGDSIPVHLLTREAIELYRQRLAPGGVIALHLSNSHLDLAPVAARIADELGLQAVLIADRGVAGDPSTAVSDWVLLAEGREVLALPPIGEAAQPVPRRAGLRTWTDDYSNILQVLTFGRGGG